MSSCKKTDKTRVQNCHILSALPLWQPIKRKFDNKRRTPAKHPSWTLTQYNAHNSQRIIVFFQYSKYLRKRLMNLKLYTTLDSNGFKFMAYFNWVSKKNRKCGKIHWTMRTLISCQGCGFQSFVVCPRNRNYSKDVSSDFLWLVKAMLRRVSLFFVPALFLYLLEKLICSVNLHRKV